MKTRALILILCSLTFMENGCTLFNDSDSKVSDPNLGRIVLRENIDSVSPGFTTTEVAHCFGEPAAIGLGDYAGFTYEYGSGSGTSGPVEMGILFAEDYADRVIQITVNPPYQGRTKEGIGLGSRRHVVRWFLGTPDAESVQTSWMRLGAGCYKGDIYFQGDSIAMIFQYNSSGVVDRINLLRLMIE